MTKPLKIVIPMAGFGSRLRPLTWSNPKPLVSLAGRTVLDHVLDMFRTVPNFAQAEFIFILGPMMGDQIKEHVAKHYPDWHVDYAVQPEMKGQSDAFWQARDLLDGPMLMAFSDTLIDSNFSFLAGEKKQAVAFVKPVPDPRRFGVAEVNDEGAVVKLVEKPQDKSNNLAVVGCYYFSESRALIRAIEEQIDRDVSLKGEYYLVDALNIMLEKGLKMRTEPVEVWLDAGTPDALLETNRYLMEHGQDNSERYAGLKDTIIIPPVNIHPDATISHSVLGPNLSLGEGAVVKDSILNDSIIGPGSNITGSRLKASIIGHNVTVTGAVGKLNLGDDSRIDQ